jgi:hypothetical protein
VTEADSEALRMIDTFASVGASKIHVTNIMEDQRQGHAGPSNAQPRKLIHRSSLQYRHVKTDINMVVQWGKPYSPSDLRKVLPAMVRVAGKLDDCDLLDKKTGNAIGKARAGGNLMVRPMSEAAAFIQLDDLTETKLDRVRPVAFLTVRTSPGNHQAWIAVPSFATDQDRKDFTRRVKKQVTADSSATGSVRLACTSNFKAKYIGNFPKVEIIDAVPGRMTTPEALEALGLVAPEDPAPNVVRLKTSINHSRLGSERSWPDCELCVKGAPLAKRWRPGSQQGGFRVVPDGCTARPQH